MSVKIAPMKEYNHYTVNGKIVYKDSNENWIASPSLTDIEKRFFNEYRNCLENVNIPKAPSVEFHM